MKVSPLSSLDCRLLAQHLDRNSRLSGHLGIEYAILEAKDLPQIYQIEEELKSGLARKINEVAWARFWALKGREAKISGHLYLKGSLYPSSKHRCRLGMGIEPAYRGIGFGKMLINQALDWLKTQVTIDWVELYVFEHNLPAIRLYEKMGFCKVGLVEDIFRINGQSINDLIMTLRLK